MVGPLCVVEVVRVFRVRVGTIALKINELLSVAWSLGVCWQW